MKIIKEITLKSMAGKTIRYSILENGNNNKIKYGIEVSEIYDGITRQEKIENISRNKTLVLNLINYLCDHTIDTAHFEDIVEDFVSCD